MPPSLTACRGAGRPTPPGHYSCCLTRKEQRQYHVGGCVIFCASSLPGLLGLCRAQDSEGKLCPCVPWGYITFPGTWPSLCSTNQFVLQGSVSKAFFTMSCQFPPSQGPNSIHCSEHRSWWWMHWKEGVVDRVRSWHDPGTLTTIPHLSLHLQMQKSRPTHEPKFQGFLRDQGTGLASHVLVS